MQKRLCDISNAIQKGIKSMTNLSCFLVAFFALSSLQPLIPQYLFASPKVLQLATVEDLHTIPRVLHLTYKDYHKIPTKVWDLLREMAPEYKIKFYDDAACREFISRHFKRKTLNKFDSLVLGAHKADLFRYCVLYVHGGVYFDIKIKPDVPLSQMFDHEKLDVFYTVLSAYDHIFQGFLATYPKNNIFLNLINRLVDTPNYEIRKDYEIFLRQFRDELKNMIGHDLTPGEHPLNSRRGSVVLYQEINKQENGESKDRYGSYCGIYTDNTGNFRLAKTRYSDFPWK